MTKMCIII